jgi:hypothetical protein
MASQDHHDSHGSADHSPATDQLSPNEHRQHAEPDEHTGTPAMRAMATMPPSSGTGSGQPALTIGDRLLRDGPGVTGVHPAPVPGLAVGWIARLLSGTPRHHSCLGSVSTSWRAAVTQMRPSVVRAASQPR